jgi:hypothetical protein
VIEGMPPTCTNQTVPYGTALLRVALSQALCAQATIVPPGHFATGSSLVRTFGMKVTYSVRLREQAPNPELALSGALYCFLTPFAVPRTRFAKIPVQKAITAPGRKYAVVTYRRVSIGVFSW